MGGISLGKAVASSGLLQEITSKYLTPFLLTLAGPDGDNGWLVFLVVTGVVVVITTFISHTVGAMIILPIVAEIGAKFGLSRTLVVGAGKYLYIYLCPPPPFIYPSQFLIIPLLPPPSPPFDSSHVFRRNGSPRLIVP